MSLSSTELLRWHTPVRTKPQQGRVVERASEGRHPDLAQPRQEEETRQTTTPPGIVAPGKPSRQWPRRGCRLTSAGGLLHDLRPEAQPAGREEKWSRGPLPPACVRARAYDDTPVDSKTGGPSKDRDFLGRDGNNNFVDVLGGDGVPAVSEVRPRSKLRGRQYYVYSALGVPYGVLRIVRLLRALYRVELPESSAPPFSA